MMELDAKMPLVPTGDEVIIDTQEEVEMEEEDGNVNSGVGEDASKCCYPNCVFANMPTSPPLYECQATCGKKGNVHHACNINWLESKGMDVELSNLCFHCVCSQFADVQV